MRIIPVLALVALVAGVGDAADFQVITHPSNSVDSIAKKDLARIFLKIKSRWPTGERAKPIDQKASSPVTPRFSEAVLGRDLKGVESYWNSQVFAGKGTPPPTAGTDQEVVDFVKNNPGAVGYVSSTAQVSGVKVLEIVE
jgi:ABC-type phosphate transport system substrate-binding protein